MLTTRLLHPGIRFPFISLRHSSAYNVIRYNLYKPYCAVGFGYYTHGMGNEVPNRNALASKPGSLLLAFASRPSLDGSYDWENRTVFGLSVNECGTLLHHLREEKDLELIHRGVDMKRPGNDADKQLEKTFHLRRLSDGSGSVLSLTVRRNGQQDHIVYEAPIDQGERIVLVNLIEHCIPLLTGLRSSPASTPFGRG